MIIFDLDGTLANCEHRRHFVDVDKNPEVNSKGYIPRTGEKWKPDWDAFYEACDMDEPIWPVIKICNLLREKKHVEIWSGRSISVKDKTFHWLRKYIPLNKKTPYFELAMRPIRNTEPDEVLKGRWLDESIAAGKTIEYVFDDRPKMVKWWHSRGIFCFNVNQTGADF